MARRKPGAGKTDASRKAATLPYIPSRASNETLLEEKRAKIEAAAFQCFRKTGYYETTIDEIASAAGMSVGNVYRYVQRKEDILLLVLDRLLVMLEGELKGIMDLPLPPQEKLFAAMHVFYVTCDRERDRIKLAYRETSALDRERREYIKQRELDTTHHIEVILRQGMDRGLFRQVDPHLVAYDIIFLGHMWVLKGWHLREFMSLDEYVQHRFRLVMELLSPRTARNDHPD